MNNFTKAHWNPVFDGFKSKCVKLASLGTILWLLYFQWRQEILNLLKRLSPKFARVKNVGLAFGKCWFLWAEVLMNFCHGQKTSEILITLGKFLWSVLPPLTCGVHVGNCIVLSPQFCSSYFLNPLWALYHNATSRNTVSVFVTGCHDSKNLAFFTMHFLQPYTRHKYTCYLQPHIYNLHSKTATFLPPNCLFCLLIF